MGCQLNLAFAGSVVLPGDHTFEQVRKFCESIVERWLLRPVLGALDFAFAKFLQTRRHDGYIGFAGAQNEELLLKHFFGRVIAGVNDKHARCIERPALAMQVHVERFQLKFSRRDFLLVHYIAWHVLG